MNERISVIDSDDSVRLIALVRVSKDAVTISVTSVVTSLYIMSLDHALNDPFGNLHDNDY